MNRIARHLEDLGGIAPKSALRDRGVSDRELTAAVRAGKVTRPRRGWYSVLDPSDPRYRARAQGGRLTGSAALRLRGAWMWSEPALSVSVPTNASRLPAAPPGVKVHYDSPLVVERGDFGVVDLRDALARAMADSTFEEAVALLDWCRRAGVLDTVELAESVAALPRSAAQVGRWPDDECQSFLESVVRTRLRVAGHQVVSQVPVSNGQWIDLVVDGVIALELDGRAFHADTFEADRRKDLAITVDGRHALRVSYAMVKDAWQVVLSAVTAAVELARRRRTVRKPRLRRVGRPVGAVNWSLPEVRRPRDRQSSGERAGMRRASDRLAHL